MDKYLQQTNDWKECLWRIARKEVQVFEGNNLAYVNDLIYCNCRRHLMVWIYGYLIGNKKAKRIEDLESEVKKEMKAFVIEICSGKTTDINKMVEIAKVFYVIEYFLNENKTQ